MSKKIVIIGAGASGFFAAITAAEELQAIKKAGEVHLLESAPHYLQKVRISGGGRCNVTHHLFEIPPFCQNYPRGSKELRSPLQQFQAKDTVEWFAKRGVKLISEEDGRMFPSTNRSDTIINCFRKSAEKLGVMIHTHNAVRAIEKQEECFQITMKDGQKIEAQQVLIATGSSTSGYSMAEKLGHTISERAPSLFSFKIDHPLLKGLAGTSFKKTIIKMNIDKKKLQQQGPLLITHWGLSGPAIIKLSAWYAREMKRNGYRTTIKVNWLGIEKVNDVENLYQELKKNNEKSLIKNILPSQFTKRFWIQFLQIHNIPEEKKWNEISKKELSRLIENSFQMPLEIEGQNRFKDEFVECGGIDLKEIDFKTMESKLITGLHFSGEILDIDGITGGFNFQNAWTTGFIAGKHMAKLL